VVEPAVPVEFSPPGESIAMRSTIPARRTIRLVALLSPGILSGCGGTPLETAWIQASRGLAGIILARAWEPQGSGKARTALLALRQFGLVAGCAPADGEELRILPSLFAGWMRMIMTAEECRRWML
jgi:hypothetical protein